MHDGNHKNAIVEIINLKNKESNSFETKIHSPGKQGIPAADFKNKENEKYIGHYRF